MILKTTESKKHYHMVYIGRDGMGMMASALDHVHPFDPMTGQFSEADGHIHDGIEPVKRMEKKGPSDQDEVKRIRDLYREACDNEKASIMEAREAERFVLNNQWDDGLRQDLESSDRACLTLDITTANLETLEGHRLQTITDIKYSPVEGSDESVASLITDAVRVICQLNRLSDVEYDVIRDQQVVGRGLFHVYVDREEIEPKIKIEHYQWDDVIFGQHNKRDCSDLEFLFKRKRYSKKRLKELWPDSEDAGIDEIFEFRDEDIGEIQTEIVTGNYDPISGNTFVDMKRKSVLVLECEELFTERVPVFVNPDDGFTMNLDGWRSPDVKAVKEFGSIIRTPVKKLKRTKLAGDVILDSETVDDEGGFSIIPVYAKKAKTENGGRFWGKVLPVMDAQRLVNYTASVGVDLFNKMAGATGYYYDDQTFANSQELTKFINTSSKPGFVVKVQDTSRKIPVRVEGARVPPEIIAAQENAKQYLREIMNIRPDLPMGDRTSAAAMMEANRQSLSGNEYLNRNMSLAKLLLGNKLLVLMQKLYKDNPGKIVRMIHRGVTQSQDQQAAMQEQQERDGLNRLITEIFSREDLNLDVTVTPSPHSETAQIYDFIMMSEMAGRGAPIPPDALIQASPMSANNKQMVIQSIQAAGQAAEAKEARKYQTEIDKVAISKGGMPPQPQPEQQLQGRMI